MVRLELELELVFERLRLVLEDNRRSPSARLGKKVPVQTVISSSRLLFLVLVVCELVMFYFGCC